MEVLWQPGVKTPDKSPTSSTIKKIRKQILEVLKRRNVKPVNRTVCKIEDVSVFSNGDSKSMVTNNTSITICRSKRTI